MNPTKPRILVAEDEAIVARDICQQLLEMGYDPVASASTAERALELVDELRPDLILMDIHLAGAMDGITAATAVREKYALPVIFLTAFSAGGKLTRAKLAAPFGYITKPFDEHQLHTAIEFALYKHQIEHGLRVSEAKYRGLFESTTDAVALLDTQHFFDCNAAILDLFGCSSREAFCAMHPADVSPVTQADGVDSCQLANQHIQQAMAEGRHSFEWLHRRVDTGVTFHAEILLSAIEIDTRRVLQAVVRDISARKQTEEQLRRARQLLDSIVENMPAMVFMKRASDLRFELFNRAGEKLLGHSRTDLIGKNDHDFFPREQADAFEAADREVLETIDVREILSEPITTAKGETRFLHTKKVVLRDDSGAATHLLGISLDITEQKQAVEAMIVAKEQAELDSTAKSQFLANMSHEIRTPMNAIMGMLKLLQNTFLSPGQRDYASKAENAAKSLLRLINNILDYSKIDAGKMTLDPQPFRLNRLLRELSVILSTNLGAKPVEVVFKIDPAIPSVLQGDSMCLQQILGNLAGNAIKFTPKGEVIVQVELVAISIERALLKFSVSDTGIGIAAENQQRIFDGFSQAEASTARHFGGTGLGLTICANLVKLMGGDLIVTSELGKGSTFQFTLDLPQVDEAVDPEPPAPRSLGKMEVLVVDHHETARDALLTMARSWGWQADSATGGLAAIAMIEARQAAGKPHYEAIFVDADMPDVDAWKTSLRIRKLIPETEGAIIVLVSADGRELLSRRNIEERAHLNGFLVKPVTASLLFDSVVDAKASHSERRTYPRSAAASRQKRLKGLRVLLAEDNVVNQQVAMELLRFQGASVDVVDNGQDAVSALANAPTAYDAVLMDVQMPEMDGYAATRAIRRELGLKVLPIIAMTANALDSDRDECLAAGMNDHVGKPFDISHLTDVLLRQIARVQASAPSHAPYAPPMPEDQTSENS